jgi:hypothetical protein
MDYNLYFYDTNVVPKVFWGSDYGWVSLDQLKKINLEPNGIVANPQFQGLDNLTYVLGVNSPAKSSGVTLHPDYSVALSPEGSDWDSIPPMVLSKTRNYSDNWDRGPYTYMAQPNEPKNLRIKIN